MLLNELSEREPQVEVIVASLSPAEERGRFTIQGDPRLAWMPGGDALLGVLPDGKARSWAIPAGTAGPEVQLPAHIETLAYSPDGAWIAAGTEEGWVELLSASFEVLGRLGPEVGAVDTLAWSPDGKLLAAAGSDDAVALWDVPGRRLIARLRGSHGHPGPLAFAPDGHTLATGFPDGTVRLWDLTGAAIRGEDALSAWLQRLGLRWTDAALEPDPGWGAG